MIVDGPVFRTAQVDVTPDELLPLGGYTARKDAKMDPEGEPLFARTLVVEQGATKIAIVSFEALTVPESLYAAVRGRIPAGVELFMAATHTHSAPDSQMLNERMTFKVPGIASFSRRWLDWYAQKIASCVTSALSTDPIDAVASKLVVAQVSANRGRREGAAPNKSAAYITIAGKPFITHYAAHGTLYDEKRTQTSGDWPGAVSNALGGLVLTGAIGDVSPDFPTDVPRENLSNMVDKLWAGLEGGQVIALFKDRPSLAWTSEKIELDKPIPHPDFNKSFGAAPPLDQVLVGRFAPSEASVFLASLGAVLIIGIPGEPTSEVGRKIESIATQSGFPHVIVVSHTNGWIGYVLTPEDYDRGGYEATLSFHGRNTATKVIDAAERAIKRLAQLPRVAHVR